MKYILYTFLYILFLLIIALIPFGGGHGTSLFLIIPAAPFFTGLLILPLAAWLAINKRASVRKFFLIIIGIHYAGVIFHAANEITFQPQNVAIIIKDLFYIIIPWIFLYLAGNIILWKLYLKKN